MQSAEGGPCPPLRCRTVDRRQRNRPLECCGGDGPGGVRVTSA